MPDISSITLPNGDTYNFKDNEARNVAFIEMDDDEPFYKAVAEKYNEGNKIIKTSAWMMLGGADGIIVNEKGEEVIEGESATINLDLFLTRVLTADSARAFVFQGLDTENNIVTYTVTATTKNGTTTYASSETTTAYAPYNMASSKYTKPASGIPKSDLSSEVQSSLDAGANALAKSGGTMSGAIAMGSNKITGLANGTAATDAAAFGQIPVASTTAPQMDGTAAVGTGKTWARADHVHPTDTSRMAASLKGKANGVAELDSSGKVPSSQLPSYVDDVLEYSAKSSFPSTGETGKIYVDTSTNLTYRWGGSAYVEISPSLALGETSSTAYRGDRGKAAYDHSQLTSGNPHKVGKSDVGLGNVDNTSDATKKTNFTGSIASGNTGFVTGGAAYTELSKKLDKSGGEISGKLTIGANGKVRLFEDNEGGNIEWSAPNGEYSGIDSHNNTETRIFTFVNDKYHSVRWNRTDDIDLSALIADDKSANAAGAGGVTIDSRSVLVMGGVCYGTVEFTVTSEIGWWGGVITGLPAARIKAYFLACRRADVHSETNTRILYMDAGSTTISVQGALEAGTSWSCYFSYPIA